MPHSVGAAEKCVLQKVPVNENKNLFFILVSVKHECHGIFFQLVIQCNEPRNAVFRNTESA